MVKGRKSEFFGDFDADGAQDHVMLVKTSSLSPSELANSNVNVAWPYYGEGEPPAPPDGGPVTLLITNAYKTDKKARFLIVDPNPISILATEASTEMFVATRNGSNETVWAEVGDAVAGDVLVIPTEAGIDSYLYWDGEKYTSLEVLEIP